MFIGALEPAKKSGLDVAASTRMSPSRSERFRPVSTRSRMTALPASPGNPAAVVNPAGVGEQNGAIYLGVDGTGVMNISGTGAVRSTGASA